MINGKVQVPLSEEDLKEIFSLFTTVSKDELLMIYEENNPHYYLKANLEDEYELCEEKREFAIDAWRAVLYFLYRKGYSLIKERQAIDLSFSENLFIGTD
jgi:hypothetical protein